MVANYRQYVKVWRRFGGFIPASQPGLRVGGVTRARTRNVGYRRLSKPPSAAAWPLRR